MVHKTSRFAALRAWACRSNRTRFSVPLVSCRKRRKALDTARSDDFCFAAGIALSIVRLNVIGTPLAFSILQIG